MAVALLGLLVVLAIADCTEVAIAGGVRMRTLTMTLPDVIVTITADGSTPARAAIAVFISVRTLGVKEETSPASRRAKSTTLIAGSEGGGEGCGGSDHGEGDAGEGGKRDRGNGGAITGLLPAEELSALVGLGATPAWACCARRWLSCTACIPTARARWLVSAPVEKTTPGGSGGHVPHATGQLVRAKE